MQAPDALNINFQADSLFTFNQLFISKLSFKRKERLKSHTVITRLFKEGKSFGMYPLRLIWVKIDPPLSEYPVQFSLSVPKRKFPKAVDRNRLRRLVREAYRLNKSSLYQSLENTNQQYGFMVLYVAKDPLPFIEINAAMKRMLKKFARRQTSSKMPTNQSPKK